MDANLVDLFEESAAVLADRAAFAPALDWVDRILPQLPAACRQAAIAGDVAAFRRWLEWTASDAFLVLRDAGRGELFEWRRSWTVRLCETGCRLASPDTPPSVSARRALAEEMAGAHRGLPGCFPVAFWHALIRYLCSPPNAASDGSARVAFPLVLSDRVVVDGVETDVLMAVAVATLMSEGTGELFLHPDQAPLRAMDGRFARAFELAGKAVCKIGVGIPDIGIRLHAADPNQERFLDGLLLRGASASGALAAAALCALQGIEPDRSQAVSFLIEEPIGADLVATFRLAGGMQEKIRGCARHGVRRLLTAHTTDAELNLLARRQGVELVGVSDLVKAAHALASVSHSSASPLSFDAQGDVAPDSEDRGGLPLGSPDYVVREQDEMLERGVARRPMIVLVKGAHQMGKSSLLVRGIEWARQRGARIVYTDFQKLTPQELLTPTSLFQAFGRMFSRQLRIASSPEANWNPNDSPNMNFEYWLLDHVLPGAGGPIFWFMDEADRMFGTSFYPEIFGLMRSWHNDRQVARLWHNLTIVLAYSAETHLFIRDPHQSPFNVGLRLELSDFTLDQCADLNVRHGSPLGTPRALEQFFALVGGHPYLTQYGLGWMRANEQDLHTFEALAHRDEGPVGDHLRRLRSTVQRSNYADAVSSVLTGRARPSPEAFYHLRSAGVLAGESAEHARLRCRLYEQYLLRSLGTRR